MATTHEIRSAGVDSRGVSTVVYLPKQDHELGFPIDRTALLIIDPVNDFLSEGGAGWELTKTTVAMNNVVANLRRLIEGARSCGVSVLYGPMAYTSEDYADKALQRRSAINRIMFENKMFLAGSWGADFHPDLRPGPDRTTSSCCRTKASTSLRPTTRAPPALRRDASHHRGHDRQPVLRIHRAACHGARL